MLESGRGAYRDPKSVLGVCAAASKRRNLEAWHHCRDSAYTPRRAQPRGRGETQMSRWRPPPAVLRVCGDRIALDCESRLPLCPGCFRQ